MSTLLTYLVALVICNYGLFFIVGGPPLANKAARRMGSATMRIIVALLKLPFTILVVTLRDAWHSRQQQSKW